MKNKTFRKLATLAASTAIAVGGMSLAPSAAAAATGSTIQPLATFGGTHSCTPPQRIGIALTTTGGNVTVYVAGKPIFDGSISKGANPVIPSTVSSGAWTATGAISSASPVCYS